jgi:DNA-binding transcriptional regulator YhcF (GntR family)
MFTHVDDIVIDQDSPVAPYEQLRTQIAGRVASGELPPGTRLATVRQTAQRLGVAVNTVARAYRELEADEVVVTEGRRGTFVRSETLEGTTDATEGVRQAAIAYGRTARRAGLTRAEAVRLLESCWA